MRLGAVAAVEAGITLAHPSGQATTTIRAVPWATLQAAISAVSQVVALASPWVKALPCLRAVVGANGDLANLPLPAKVAFAPSRRAVTVVAAVLRAGNAVRGVAELLGEVVDSLDTILTRTNVGRFAEAS